MRFKLVSSVGEPDRSFGTLRTFWGVVVYVIYHSHDRAQSALNLVLFLNTETSFKYIFEDGVIISTARCTC